MPEEKTKRKRWITRRVWVLSAVIGFLGLAFAFLTQPPVFVDTFDPNRPPTFVQMLIPNLIVSLPFALIPALLTLLVGLVVGMIRNRN